MNYLIIGIVVMVILKALFGHHHVSGYTNTGLPIYTVGPTYDLDNEKVPRYHEDRGALGVTINEFRCECGKNITEKMR